MKLAAILSATALVFIADVNAAPCDVASLSKLLTSPDTTKCGTASGYAVTSLTSPTEKQMAIMCTNEACQSVMSQIHTLAPSECTLGKLALYADLLNPFTDTCEGVASPDSNIGSKNNLSATSDTVNATPDSPPSLTFANLTDSIEPDDSTESPLTPEGFSTDQLGSPTTSLTDQTEPSSISSTDQTVGRKTPSADQTTTSAMDLVTPEDSSNFEDSNIVEDSNLLENSNALQDSSTSQNSSALHATTPSPRVSDSTSSLDADSPLVGSSASATAVSAGVFFAAVAVALF